MRSVLLMTVVISIFGSCQSIRKRSNQIQLINSSCDLQDRVNDTIVVSGSYSRCMEYSRFNTLKNDSCSANSNIELDWKQVGTNHKLYRKINKINEFGCGGSIKMILKGVLKKGKLHGYGHAGSNDMELEVIEVMKLGRVKYSYWN